MDISNESVEIDEASPNIIPLKTEGIPKYIGSRKWSKISNSILRNSLGMQRKDESIMAYSFLI